MYVESIYSSGEVVVVFVDRVVKIKIFDGVVVKIFDGVEVRIVDSPKIWNSHDNDWYFIPVWIGLIIQEILV